MKIHDHKFGRCVANFFGLIFLALAAGVSAQSIQFHDATTAAGITPNDPSGFGHGTSFGDFNGDGRPDIYMISYATANFLFRNNGGSFTDIAAAAGVQFPTPSDRGMAAADYDNDGDLDLYIAAGYTGNVLYRNDGGNFTNVTAAANVDLAGQGQGVAWGDYNNDGLLDLFVTQTDGDNVLFRQNSDHTFTNANAAAGIGNFSASLQPVFFDVDNDGDVDLFVARQNNYANLLYINNGNATFTERAGTWGVTATAAHAQGAAIGDYDRDGDLDIYVCDYDGFNLLFRNNGNGFTEVATSAGVRSGFTGNRGAVFADFNDDGWLDIYVTRSNDNKMYQNNGDGTFNDVSGASGTADTNNGYSPSTADYDNDGDLDIFFSNTGQNSVLLQNDGPFNNWLQIKLIGNASNRDGVGAKLTGWLNGQRQTQVIISGQAYLCTGSDLTAHFALGSGNKLDSLIIRWPAGTIDRFANLSANQKLTLQEGDGGSGGSDTTPPLISNVGASNITASTAAIDWSTDEAGDSQVEYGLTTSYGNSTTLNTSLVTGHSESLSSLQANTLYHYRVKSKDAAGNLATSGDFTFTTLAQPATILTDDFNAGTLDLNKWVKGANTGNQSSVVSNQLELRSTGVVSGWIITKNSYPALNTTVTVKVTQPNNDGDLGMSPNYTASASSGIFNQNNWYRFYTYRNGSTGPYLLFAQWKKNGVVNGIDVTGSLVINGAVYLRLRFDQTNIHFEASLDNVNWTDTYTEAFGLPGYTLNSSFYYELAAYNTSAKGVLTVDDFAISNNAPTPDTTPPVISSVAASNITTSAATINWTTNEASDSQVEYGLTTSYGASTPLSVTLVTSHSVALSSLQANTLYHYRVKSKDAAGNLATSGDFTFTTLANDVTPPVISSVAASNITTSAATISWTTNEASDSQVEYGLTTSYGASTPLSVTLVTGHSVALSSLQASTLYHYRVKSKDAAGNLATSGDFTFTTSAQPATILADDFNTGTLDLNKWVKGTNTGNQASVVSNQLELRSTGIVSGWIITKNSYPALNTTVTIKVTQPNNDGDLGMSPNYTASASSGIFNQNDWYRFYTYRNGSTGPYLLFAQWKKNGVVNGIDVTGGLVINGAVYLRLRFDQTNIHFEASLDNVNWTDTYTEAFGLPGYTLNSSFYYELAAYNTSAKGVLTVDDFAISNNAPTPDTTPPVISSVAASNITTSAATINWTTNEASDSQVEYGLTTSYGASTPLSVTLVTSHAAALSSLQANTLYHYRVKSKDAAGNLATSGDFTFTTLANDVTPPVISSVAASNITTSAATINWTTNEASDSQVEYGLTTSYGNSTTLNTSLVISHSVSLAGLQANTTYHYRVKSKDAAGNLATSGDFTFTTLAQPATILTDDFNTGTLDLNKWVKGTNAGNQAAVVSNQLELRSTGVVSGWIITKNSYPALNTTVTVKVTQPNNDGDLGMSPNYTASASSGIFNQNDWYRFYTYRNGSTGPYLLFAQWKKNGVVNGIDVTGSLVINGAVYLRLRFDQTNIHFEASLDNVNWTDTYTEAFGLPGYTLNSSFYYELAAYNTSAKGVLTVDDFAISNSNPTPDTTPPTISSVAASNITTSAATISWTTNEASDSQVEYGLTTSYGNSTTLNTSLVTGHSESLSSLQANTLYHYRVKSKDAAGNLATSGDFTFTTVNAQFVDITASAGVAGIPDYGGHAIIFADVNGDDRADMYVTHTNFAPSAAPRLFYDFDPRNPEAVFLVLPDELFINNGNNTFTENAAAAGVDDPGESHGAVFVDIDNDGDFDLFNGQRGPSGNRLYTNNGNGTFTEVTASAGILLVDRRTIGVLALDIENDGDMDLFSSNWGVGNEMYVNDGTGHFTVEERGVTDVDPDSNGTMAATAADVDNDGDMDIFVGKRIDVAGDASKLYINNGSGYFTDQAAARGVAFTDHSNGAVFVDLDGDGDLDMLLAVSGVNRSNPLIKLGVYRNQGSGTFVDETNVHNIPFDGFTLNAGDLDNDGDSDIFTYINSSTGQVWLNNGAGQFTQQTNAGFSHVATDARAGTLADIDNDGDLDIAFTEINAPTSLYRNDLITGSGAQNYLQIKLTGANGRVGLFGSKFYLYEAGHLDDPAYLRGYQQLTSTLGTLSQNFPIAHFGVAPAQNYDLRVRLLDGNSIVRTNLAPGQRLNLQTAPDTQAPVISSVAASGLTSAAATITWTTNEAADSQVEYGLTTSYGASTPLSVTPLTNHAVALSGLNANTLYHYRVKSKDAAGNLATSNDFTFTTLATGTVVLSDDFDGGALNLTKWNKGTNAGNQSAVINNQLVLRSQGNESGWVITKSAYVAQQTIVQVKVAQPNSDGALGMTPTYTLSSQYGIYNENNWYRFYTYGAAPRRLLVQWKKNGVENDIDVTGNLVVNAAIYLRLRFDATKIYFEASFDGAAWTTAYSEAFGLPGYTLASAFYYELTAYNTQAKGDLIVDDFSITTFSANPDIQPPLISQVSAQNLTTTSAEIVWQTDEPADAQVEYGLTTSYDNSTALNTSLVISHSVALSGLQAGTTYHYRVHSRDAAGNLATSNDLTFTTTPGTTVGNVAFANVQDIFNNNCSRCHQGATAPGGLVLLAGQAHANIVNVPSTEYPQWQRVQPGDRATSWLYTKITIAAPPVGSKMGSLTADEIELIGDWIDQGATIVPALPYVDLQFRTPSVINGEINISYFSSFTVWGGLPPYQFSHVGGDLPPGIGLDPAGGVLYGSPTLAGVYDFTIRVSDSQSPAATLDQAYHIEVYNTRAHWQLPAGYVIENVVSDLHLPVNITFAPNPGTNPTDPYFYVTLLYGDIIMVQRNFQKQTYATGLLNFAPTAEFPGSGEIGVTGIVVDPISGDVFASMVYEGTPGAEDFYGKVVRFHSTDGGRTAATQTVILSGIPAGVSHMIQEVTIGPDEKLYVNLGDGWTPEASPDLNDLRGKVLRLNFDGSTPDDNPYPNSLVYASGFRNPFGAAWRQADAKLYISDNGPEFDDRLALVIPGANYGWEAILPDLTKGAIFLWNPTVAPVGMNFLENNAFPAQYLGDLFVGLSWPPYQGGLSARGKKIQRFTLNAAGQVTSDSLFLDYIGAGASTVIGVAFGPDGLYFTDLYGENGFDQFGQTRANVYRIRWGAADVTPPVITNVLATSITGTSATIVWQTDEPATRQVEYGLTANYGSSTPVETNRSTTHSVKLNGLSPETTYHFHALSVDVANNPAISADFTFTTTAIDTTPPIISNVQVDSSGATLAVVTWTTNEPTNSHVDFGATASYGFTQSDAAFVTQHRIELTGLADSTFYHFRVRSSDVSSNETISAGGTFTTRRQLVALVDHFDGAALDSLNWNLGANAGNQSSVISNRLVLQSQGTESGWVITKNAYAGRQTTAQVNVVQPNGDGALGMTPTRTLSSPFGIVNENNWYRFYVYGPAPRRLIVQWKKNGVENDLDVTGNMAITLQSGVYLRLRCDATQIYFEASFDGVAWTTAYAETFGLPGYSLNSAFYFELAAYNTAVKGNLIVDDFSITTVSGAPNAPPSMSQITAPNLAPALLPEKFALQNYPNPFNAATRIRFALPQAAEIEVKIFDLAGRELLTPATGERSAGNHEVIWNGRGRDGQELSSGVYLVRLRYRTDRLGAWSQLLHRVLLVK